MLLGNPTFVSDLGGFVPKDVSGLIANWDTNTPGAITTSGNNFIQLKDSYGNFHLDSTADKYPTIVQSGNKRWGGYHGSHDIHIKSALVTGVPFTVYTVFVASGIDNINALWSTNDPTTFDSQFAGLVNGIQANDPLGIWRREPGGGGAQNVTTDGVVVGKPYIMSCYFINETFIRIRLNNDANSEGGSTNTVVIPTNLDRFGIGAEADLNPAWHTHGLIGQTLFYNRNLFDTSENDEIIKYLAKKWDVPGVSGIS